MDNSFWLLLVFIFAFWLGKQWAYTSIAYKFFRLAKQHGIDLDKEEPIVTINKIPDCNIEVHNDMMYLFEKNTDTFLCQGQTFEELATKLKNHLGITQAKITYNDKNLYLINGEFKKE